MFKFLRKLLKLKPKKNELLEEVKSMRRLLSTFIKVWDEDSVMTEQTAMEIAEKDKTLKKYLTSQEEMFKYIKGAFEPMKEYFRIETEEMKKIAKLDKIEPTEHDKRF